MGHSWMKSFGLSLAGGLRGRSTIMDGFVVRVSSCGSPLLVGGWGYSFFFFLNVNGDSF